MSITERFRSLFDPRIRKRGESYFYDRLVHIKYGDERAVRARVLGSEYYAVDLSIKANDFLVSCTCPYFDEDLCKHIWATMLAAESKGFLYGDGSLPSRLRMMNPYSSDGEYVDEEDYDDDYFDDDDEIEIQAVATLPQRKSASPQPSPPKGQPPKSNVWKQHLAAVSRAMQEPAGFRTEQWSFARELFYIVDVASTVQGNGIIVDMAFRERKQNGEWSKLKQKGLPAIRVSKLENPDDRRILSLMSGAKVETYGYYSSTDTVLTRYRLIHPIEQMLLPMMCATGRCLLRRSPQDDDMPALEWDDGEAWELWLEVRRSRENEDQYVITGSLRRDDDRMEISKPAMLTSGGLVFDETSVARLNDFGAFAWISLLRERSSIYVPVAHRDQLLAETLSLPNLPRLDLEEDLRYEETTVAPKPRLKITKPERTYWGRNNLRGEVSFDYEGEIIAAGDGRRGIYQAEARRFVMRDRVAEASARERLKQLGFKYAQDYYNSEPRLELAANNLPRAVRLLVREGWYVEAEGKLYRQPGEFNIQVTSGIDWFDLNGTFDFDGMQASLPELLAALKRGDNAVLLGDGTFGLLPEDWLKKYGALAEMGEAEGDQIRFKRSQVGLLDALLASMPEATFDKAFARARDELQRFTGVKPAAPPAGFTGKLRGYQKDGLGWLHFIQQFGFGGCLADDMGLGKTVMALAMLESRRELRARNGASKKKSKPSAKSKAKSKKPARANGNGEHPRVAPSLIVVPKSLVFNWKQEARRFTPDLRILDHTGQGRLKPGEHFEDYDAIITTYGTLRRDAVEFKDINFDYIILDEAQAIKNAATEASKAARLLRGNHKLALSGTPVENHLGELWALFDFLNPGLLGTSSLFKTGTAARNPDEETRELLARALRPFILRRTKEQVARDLPPKLEQTIYCEMEREQRKLYNELRDHYRNLLLGLVDERGIKQSKFQILEALLRLRQAACHPGLIDKKRAKEDSAKLDMLMSQLKEVMEEDHKTLVFSQFTSLLAIVRDRLDKEGIVYEYLDGRTRDRQARVERFQTDADCKLFLISLKAGGLGLNLTAAEYVFLLDPWWNPAVEAQAIDRAHRIGQSKQVFAYRLIARDTVEEKVLELQQTKRELADAIINADNSLIRSLGREDLELLLS